MGRHGAVPENRARIEETGARGRGHRPKHDPGEEGSERRRKCDLQQALVFFWEAGEAVRSALGS
jgi:hypothetical protein